MSHVSSVDLFVTDLDALDKACDELGLELQRGKTEWAWWGSDAGDSNLAPGFNRSHFGKGEHAIKVKGTSPRMGSVGPWEIGVVKRPDGKRGYALLYDQWGMHGRALEQVAGRNLVALKHAIGRETTRKELARQGFRVRQTVNAQGQVQLIGEAS